MESFTCYSTFSSSSVSFTFLRLSAILILGFLSIAPTLCTGGKTIVEPHLPSNTEFIKNSCGITRYPEICYKTLSAYASTIQSNPKEMANAALSVTLNGAQTASSVVVKLSKSGNLSYREAGAVVDCVEDMEDSVDKLDQSLKVMKDLNGPEFAIQMSNIQTWVSAALTDEDTCMDRFKEGAVDGKVISTIRSSVERVAQLTSNALTLINRLS